MACHPRATYHIAGCCHLVNSLSLFQSHMPHCRVHAVTWRNQCHDRATLQGVRIPSAVLKMVFRHILFVIFLKCSLGFDERRHSYRLRYTCCTRASLLTHVLSRGLTYCKLDDDVCDAVQHGDCDAERGDTSSSSSSSSMTSLSAGSEPASVVNKTNLIVNYLPQSLSQDDMLALFSSVATVDSCKLVRDKTTGTTFNPLIATLKPQSNGPSYRNTVIGTLTVDGWTVTFGTASRGLGGAAARLVPYSLYQM